MTTEPRSQGRSMKELRAIVAADTARWDRLTAAWNDLTEDEQKELVHRAEAMAGTDRSSE